MKAYILFRIKVGEIRPAVHLLHRVEAVEEAYMTYGPYDVVAVVRAKSLKELGSIVANQLQPIPGVISTLTCLAVEI